MYTYRERPGARLGLGHKFALLAGALIMLSMVTFWLVSKQTTEGVLRQQADRLGQALTRQTAILVTELVLANDLISMNVVLNQLARDDAIAQAAVLDIESRVLAIAGEPAVGSRPNPLLTSERLFGSYVAPVALQDSIAGYVRIELDQRYIEEAAVRNFQLLALALLLLLLLAGASALLLTQQSIALPLRILGSCLQGIRRGELQLCPGDERRDELGHLVRRYNLMVASLREPETRRAIYGESAAEPGPGRTGCFAEAGQSPACILEIELMNFRQFSRRLDPQDSVELLNRYLQFAAAAAELYNGVVEQNSGDRVRILFDAAADEESAFQALCCGLLILQLMGVLSDNNQAQGMPPFRVRAGLHRGEVLSGVNAGQEGRFTVAGDNVGIAGLLCAKSEENTMLVSDEFWSGGGVADRFQAREYLEFTDEQSDRLVRAWRVEEVTEHYRSVFRQQVSYLLSQSAPA